MSWEVSFTIIVDEQRHEADTKEDGCEGKHEDTTENMNEHFNWRIPDLFASELALKLVGFPVTSTIFDM